MKDILYLTQSGDTLPSVRFRVLPFIERGRKRALDMGHLRIPKSITRRIPFLLSFPRARVCIIQKKLFAPWEIKLIRKRCAILAFDFDDALWACHPSEEAGAERDRREAKIFKRFHDLLPRMDLVIAGNSYLAEKASGLSKRTYILPTPLDTKVYTPEGREEHDPVTVGWMGTASNLFFLPEVMLSLQSLNDRVRFSVVADKEFVNGDSTDFEYWSEERELEQLRGMDIGLMPLTDDEYTRGKCGFKILMYMACGAVPIASDVGFNREIITHGEDGFLVNDKSDWVNYVRLLADDPDLRKRMAEKGRQTVIDRFSLEALVDSFWPVVGL